MYPTITEIVGIIFFLSVGSIVLFCPQCLLKVGNFRNQFWARILRKDYSVRSHYTDNELRDLRRFGYVCFLIVSVTFVLWVLRLIPIVVST